MGATVLQLTDILNTDLTNTPSLYVNSGLQDLDEISGWARNGLNLILGASGKGKSIFSIYSALEVSQDTNNAVLFFSLENSTSTDIRRIQKIAKDYQNIDQITFKYINTDNDHVDLEIVKSAMAQYKLDNPDKTVYIYIDSIDFIKLASTDANAMFLQYGEVAANLVNFARDNDITIIATQQLNREAMDKPLEQQDYGMIARSVGIAQKASVIIIADMNFLEKADRDKGGKWEFDHCYPAYKIEKLRDGSKEGGRTWRQDFIWAVKDLKKKLSN